MASPGVAVRPVAGKAEREQFIELAYRLNVGDRHWVPPLRYEMRELLDPVRNPFFDHATVQLFLARRGDNVVGRISAHLDHLALAQPPEQGMGPGVGLWGLFEAEDAETAQALLAAAGQWLRERGMTRMLGPLNLSIWDEAGLLTCGHDHSPTIMMGHNSPAYQGWIEAAGHRPVKRLLTYVVAIGEPFPRIVASIVASGRRNPRISLRPMNLGRFDEDAGTMIDILNQSWSANWGFVPLTAGDIAHAKKKLRPVIVDGLIMMAEVDGEPAAFMMTIPDLNEAIRPLGGKLFPFGWARLLWWMKRRRWARFRVPLMGVVPALQNSRLASQLAFMMIESIRERSAGRYGVREAEIGWILEDNAGMISIADVIGGKVNRVYTIYEKGL